MAHATQQTEGKDQNLSLKVTRLSRPLFFTNFAFQGESMYGFESSQRGSTNATPTSDLFSLSDSLCLPKTFVQLYLGEAFVSYISTYNNSYFDIFQFGLRVEIQTQTQRFPLFDNTSTPIPKIPSTERYDTIVNYEVKELGLHILVCNISYSKYDGEKKQFRKFFRFNVTSPLSVRTKMFNVNENVFVEAHIQNSTHFPILLDVVRFEPSSYYSCVDLNVLDGNTQASNQQGEGADIIGKVNDKSVFGEMFYIKPEEVRQYLFKVAPKGTADRSSKASSNYGRIDVLWRQPMGAPGRLQTNQLQKKVTTTDSIELTVTKIPPLIYLETPFTIHCSVTNKSERVITGRLSTNPSKMSGITVNGLSGKDLGEISPGASKVISIDLFPLVPGVHKITGLIVDVNGDRFYEPENLPHIFVQEFSSEDGAPEHI